MRISDWSSDVCSSDLVDRHFAFEGDGGPSQAFGYRFDIAKQAGEPPDFAGLVLFAALDDQVVGVAAGDDFLRVVGRRAQHADSVIMRQQNVFYGLVGDRKSTRLHSSH